MGCFSLAKGSKPAPPSATNDRRPAPSPSPACRTGNHQHNHQHNHPSPSPSSRAPAPEPARAQAQAQAQAKAHPLIVVRHPSLLPSPSHSRARNPLPRSGRASHALPRLSHWRAQGSNARNVRRRTLIAHLYPPSRAWWPLFLATCPPPRAGPSC